MTIREKYIKLRPQIEDGDLILFRGTGIVARIIRFCDSSYYNHIGVVIKSHGSLFILDANANGVQADRLSHRIATYSEKSDFCIIQPKILNTFTSSLVEKGMHKLLAKSDNKWIRYDYLNGIKELLNRKLGWNLKIKMKENAAICSSNVAQYAIDLGIMNGNFEKLSIAFPQDFCRFADETKVLIIK